MGGDAPGLRGLGLVPASPHAEMPLEVKGRRWPELEPNLDR